MLLKCTLPLPPLNNPKWLVRWQDRNHSTNWLQPSIVSWSPPRGLSVLTGLLWLCLHSLWLTLKPLTMPALFTHSCTNTNFLAAGKKASSNAEQLEMSLSLCDVTKNCNKLATDSRCVKQTQVTEQKDRQWCLNRPKWQSSETAVFKQTHKTEQTDSRCVKQTHKTEQTDRQ